MHDKLQTKKTWSTSTQTENELQTDNKKEMGLLVERVQRESLMIMVDEGSTDSAWRVDDPGVVSELKHTEHSREDGIRQEEC